MWAIQPTPVPGGVSRPVSATLAAIACPSDNACVAVGSLPSSVGTTVLVDRFNRVRWERSPAPSPGGAGSGDYSAFTGISCTSSTQCEAVGTYTSGSNGRQSFAESFNGRRWSAQTTPVPSGQSGDVALAGVSCTSASACVAVGSYSTSTQTQVPYSEVMSGTAWSVVPVPSSPAPTAPSTGLSAVACTAAADCTAAGIIGPQLLVDRWNGTEWSVVPTAHAPRGTYVDSAAGIACTSNGCITVGSDAIGNAYVHTDYAFAETETGAANSRWSLDSPQLRAVAANSELNAISCASSTACMAVGDVTAGGMRALAEHWNGQRFTIEAVKTAAAELGAVSCPTVSWCMAVGATNFDSSTAIQSSLALVWNGSGWARAGAPPGTILDSVSCTAPDVCIAVSPDGFAASWNGRRWSGLSLPGIPGLTLSFSGVSCSSSTYCTIVGEATGYCAPNSGTCNVRDVVIAERRSGGRRWALQRPVQAFGPIGLVACPAADRCIVAGVAGQVWSGGRWVAQRIPGGSVVLSALACAAADACTAVGSGRNGTAPAAEAWNGNRWSPQPMATPRLLGPSPAVAMNGIACPSTGFCLAVGSRTSTRDLSVPFAERYS
jgi:hypothetical protein